MLLKRIPLPGGSVGVALLSTLAASSVSSQLAGVGPTATLFAQATFLGYTTAFLWAEGIFLVGAIVAAALLRPGVRVIEPAGDPVIAH